MPPATPNSILSARLLWSLPALCHAVSPLDTGALRIRGPAQRRFARPRTLDWTAGQPPCPARRAPGPPGYAGQSREGTATGVPSLAIRDALVGVTGPSRSLLFLDRGAHDVHAQAPVGCYGYDLLGRCLPLRSRRPCAAQRVRRHDGHAGWDVRLGCWSLRRGPALRRR